MNADLHLIIFDCDGTLVDSQDFIVRAMTMAFEEHGLQPLDRTKVLSIVGLSLIEAISTLLPAMERRRFPKGSVIVKQGDEGDSFYVIRSGSVQVVLERQGRPEIPMATLGANEGFGEMALLADQPRSATVLAVDDVEAWQLPKRTFERLLSENLSLGLHFSRIMTRRLSMLQQKMIL